jgi:hypothetical protein
MIKATDVIEMGKIQVSESPILTISAGIKKIIRR